MDDLKPLGLKMTDELIGALGGIEGIDGYDKAALVGEGGELEHTALWHVPGGYSMRERLGEAKAIVPSAMKSGGPGTPINIPLGHINAACVRGYFDAMEVRIPDAPRAGEILFALAMSCGPGIHSRMGGLTADRVKGEDGLRQTESCITGMAHLALRRHQQPVREDGYEGPDRDRPAE